MLVWLTTCLVLVFLGTSFLIYVLLTHISCRQAEKCLTIVTEDIDRVYQECAEGYVYMICNFIANNLETTTRPHPQEELLKFLTQYTISEINLVNQQGIVIQSTENKSLGFDFHDTEETKKFLELLDGKTSFVTQQLRHNITIDNNETKKQEDVTRKFVAQTLPDNSGFVELGIDKETYLKILAAQSISLTTNWHTAMQGYVIVTDENYNIISNLHNKHIGKNLAELGLNVEEISENLHTREMLIQVLNGKKVLCMPSLQNHGHIVLAVIPFQNALQVRDIAAICLWVVILLVLLAQGIFLLILLRRTVIAKILSLNTSLKRITNGNLDEVINLSGSQEFVELGNDINSTVKSLRHYIAEVTAQIGKELVYARTIQHSILPSVFPPFPTRQEFDVFANMQAAKEVGGDFYDFFFVSPNRIAFLVADVSGKGFPAALTMMHTKTLLKSYAQSNHEITEVFALTNQDICEGNKEMVFITAWMGIMDLTTGKLEVVNAGHVRPVIYHETEGNWTIQHNEANLVLGVMKDFKFRKEEYTLHQGDKIFLYTDGITEAKDAQNQLFGEERLLQTLEEITASEKSAPTAQVICEKVMESVMTFSYDVPQADDITMLSWCVQTLPGQKVSEGLRSKKWHLHSQTKPQTK